MLKNEKGVVPPHTLLIMLAVRQNIAKKFPYARGGYLVPNLFLR
jgi:hypothetical protein